jgi:hypothetical protein
MRRLRVPLALLIVAAAYLATAVTLHLLWIASGSDGWIVAYQFLTGSFLVGIAAIGATCALAAQSLFERRDPLRRVWTLIVVGTIVRWIGHGIAYASRMVPDALPSPPPPPMEQIGRIIAGPGFLLILGAAMAIAIAGHRRLGLLARLTAVDWGFVAGVTLFALQSLRDIVHWHLLAGPTPSAIYMISWASDPLLGLLLLEAVVIRRAARAMNAVFAARCWTALAAGILLTAVGDLGIWASGRAFLPWPWLSLFWYVWPMAETAFALAPAWQLAARRAPTPGLPPRRPSHIPSLPPPMPTGPREHIAARAQPVVVTRHDAPTRVSGVVSDRIH